MPFYIYGDIYRHFEQLNVLDLISHFDLIINLSSHDGLKLPSINALNHYQGEINIDPIEYYDCLSIYLNHKRGEAIRAMKPNV